MPSHASTAPPFPILGDGIHYATPIISAAKTTEAEIVRCVLRMMQGLSSPIFQWDQTAQSFRLATAHTGIYVTHLSFSSLRNLLSQFIYAATCLHLVDGLVGKLKVEPRMPTLRAFGSLVSRRLQRLRDVALKEEMKIFDSSGVGITPTLLGLSSSLSSLCSGAEFLWQIVKGATPQAYFEPNSCVPAAEMAVHILDYLYVKLDEVCLVQGGEEEAYQTVLHLLVGSLLPFIEGLDSWLFEGALDDPFEEMFFYANGAISVEDSEFWEKSYQLRQASLPNSVKEKDQKNKEFQLCPLFIKDIAKSIVSAGKSLQLIRHVPMSTSVASGQCRDSDSGLRGSSHDNDSSSRQQGIAGLTLSEIFCVSVVGLIGDGDHISGYLQDYVLKSHKFPTLMPGIISKIEKNMAGEAFPALKCLEKNWYKILADAFPQQVLRLESDLKEVSEFADIKEKCMVISSEDEQPFKESYCPENPVISVCHTLLNKHSKSWKALSLSKNFYLPALNDEVLRDAVFGSQEGPCLEIKGTNCAFGFQFGKFEYLRSQEDTKLLEGLFPFPTLLPSFQGDVFMSELLPFQRNSTLSSKVLSWIESVEPSTTPLPVVVRQECLTVYIKQQVDYIGELILLKLMNDWRLMDELAVLRAIFLLGSGDLLQHFLTVIFNRLDKGEPWDDDFELNTILQESICNSADRMLLSAPDSLVVSITKSHNPDGDELPSTPSLASTPHKAHQHSFGIDGLDSLKFMYKVSWPIELIANTEAIKKYNQVMGFLLKVKRAKFVLDKARRWMWKGRGSATYSCKHHWLVEQKLLHFVDAFHQYVMDRVYHSAWRDLCEGMATAGSLDEVIEVHEAYLLSIQRQCFVVPDKLWALIASRINSILGLALDFYSIQRTLSSGGAASAMKAKCEMEVDRIEKRFDDCIAFLLRVLSFKLNVGLFPHLADLVTRINYNYFYMSDSGNLRTATVPEAATTRLGMAFGSRIE